jgi:hypothetical protein
MRTVKFNGYGVHQVPTLGIVVANGDVIDVPDDFENALFEDFVPQPKTRKPSVVAVTSETPVSSSPSPKSESDDNLCQN